VRWLLEGFSGVRATSLKVPLKILEKYRIVSTEERITALWEATFYQQGWIEMLWIVLGASLVAVAMLVFLRRKAGKKTETEIAF
jgi:hypothetical protein